MIQLLNIYEVPFLFVAKITSIQHRYKCGDLLGKGKEGAVNAAKTTSEYRQIIGTEHETVAVKEVTNPFSSEREFKRFLREIAVNKSLTRCASTEGLVARLLDVHLQDNETWENFTKLCVKHVHVDLVCVIA